MWHKLCGKQRGGVTDGRKLQALFVRMIDKALLRQECEAVGKKIRLFNWNPEQISGETGQKATFSSAAHIFGPNVHMQRRNN